MTLVEGLIRSEPLPAPARMPLVAKVALDLTLISSIILQRFGIGIGIPDYSLDFCICFEYLFILTAGLAGVVGLDTRASIIYIFICMSCICSLHFGSVASSTSSLYLLFLCYFPFCITVKDSRLAAVESRRIIRLFLKIALICATAGILQFTCQFFIHDVWLFDFVEYIPDGFKASGNFNTVISVGNLHKANGFFLREPSGFSQLMGLAILAEYATKRSYLKISVFGLAMLLSYSGTGFIALALGLISIARLRVSPSSVVFALLAGAVIYFGYDYLNLSTTLDRVDEFGAEGSSANDRFVAPLRVIFDVYSNNLLYTVFGLGPGMITRISILYTYHDPTWAKAIVEYGISGGLSLLVLLIYKFSLSSTVRALKFGIFCSWLLLGGHLLSGEANTQIFALVGLWSAARLDRKSRFNHQSREGSESIGAGRII